MNNVPQTVAKEVRQDVDGTLRRSWLPWCYLSTVEKKLFVTCGQKSCADKGNVFYFLHVYHAYRPIQRKIFRMLEEGPYKLFWNPTWRVNEVVFTLIWAAPRGLMRGRRRLFWIRFLYHRDYIGFLKCMRKETAVTYCKFYYLTNYIGCGRTYADCLVTLCVWLASWL